MKCASIWDRVSVVILLAAFVGMLALYGRLSERIPSHFDIHGNVDATLPRAVGAFVMPVFGLGVWGLVRFGAYLLPGGWRDRLRASPVGPAAACVLALLFALHVIMIHAALAGRTEAAALLGLTLSGFWFVMGLVLPRVRRNPFIGIRTTWTLTSDENWARTHRIGAIAFVLAGVLGLFAAALGAFWLVVAAILVSAVVPVVYSYLLARRQRAM